MLFIVYDQVVIGTKLAYPRPSVVTSDWRCLYLIAHNLFSCIFWISLKSQNGNSSSEPISVSSTELSSFLSLKMIISDATISVVVCLLPLLSSQVRV